MFRRHRPPAVIRYRIPSLPDLIDPTHLQDNFKLYSDSDIRLLNEKLLNVPQLPDKRYNKDELASLGIPNPHYGVIKNEGKLYAIYDGLSRHPSAVAFGHFGKIKAQQALESGKVSILKMIRPFTKKEFIAAHPSLQWDDEDELDELYEGYLSTTQSSLERAENEYKILAIRKAGLFRFDHEAKQRQGENAKSRGKIIGMNLAEGMELYQQNELLQEDRWLLSPLQYLKIAVEIIEESWQCYLDHVLHRDLKSENIVADSMQKVRLIDYGLSVKVDDIFSIYYGKHLVGSPEFIAPEIIGISQTRKKVDFNIPYGAASEIFAMGMVMAELYELTTEIDNIGNYSRMKVIANRYHDAFVHNKRLPTNYHLRSDILTNILAMTNNNSMYRTHYDAIHQHFKRIYKEAAQEEKLTVCMVPVSEVLSSAHIEGLVAVLRAANVNAVALIDSRKQSDKNYVLAERRLRKAGVLSMALHVFVGVDQKKLKNDIINYYEVAFQVKPIVGHYQQSRVMFSEVRQRSCFGCFHLFANRRQPHVPPVLIDLPELR